MAKYGRLEPKSFLSRIWTLVAFLMFLALSVASIGVVALKITNTLPEGVDAYFIAQKEPSYATQDGETKAEWSEKQTVSIFQSSYKNGNNETTVLSQDGENVIAPGTVSTYDFCICNDGNMAIAYELDFAFLFSVNGEETSAGVFPLTIRVQRKNAEYVLGGENEWKTITSESMGKVKGTLGVNSYEHFVLELQWAFEGNDDLDTILGNGVEECPVSLDFKIQSYAEEHTDPSAQGGIPITEDGFGQNGEEYGGTMRWDRYVVLLIATVGMFLVMLYVL